MLLIGTMDSIIITLVVVIVIIIIIIINLHPEIKLLEEQADYVVEYVWAWV
jgi:hypothetical protein